MLRLRLYNDTEKIDFGYNTYYRIREITGLGAVDKTFNTVTYSGENGQETKSFVTGCRTITMAGDIHCRDGASLELLYRKLIKATHTLPAWFVVHTERILRKIKVDQIFLNDGTRHGGVVGEFTLQLICDIPWFNDINPITVDMSEYIDCIEPTAGGYAALNPPVVWSKTGTKDAKIINIGDEKSYPIIRLYAENSLADKPDGNTQIKISNIETGKSIVLENYKPTAGEIITVNTEKRTVTSSKTNDIIKYLSTSSYLSEFYLKPGSNYISVVNTNTDINFSTVLEYNNNYAEAVF